MGKCRLIAIDIDGTLLSPDNTVSPGVAAAVERAHNEGVTIVCASGRGYRETADVARHLHGAEYAIAQHGALVKRLDGDETIFSALIPAQVVLEMARVLRENSFESFIAVDGYAEGVDYLISGKAPFAETTRELLFLRDGYWREFQDLSSLPYPGASQVGVLDTRERCLAARKIIAARFGDAYEYMILKSPRYVGWFFDIISRGAGKGVALLELAHRLNVKQEETAAIGDDINDLDMFEKAGVAFAMGNASKPIQAAADHVVATNAEDGAAEAIRRLLEDDL
jgi:Cof subfamily protein (haloacid dehalogenase superfamily)